MSDPMYEAAKNAILQHHLSQSSAINSPSLSSAYIDPRTLQERRIRPNALSAAIEIPTGRKQMVAMRMRWKEGEYVPFDFFETHATEDKVFAFLVVKGKPVILEDDKGMFPSDTLITQLRLLE